MFCLVARTFQGRMFSFVYFLPVSFLLSGKCALSCTFELCNLVCFWFSTNKMCGPVHPIHLTQWSLAQMTSPSSISKSWLV